MNILRYFKYLHVGIGQSLQLIDSTNFCCWWSTTHVCSDSLVAAFTSAGSMYPIPVSSMIHTNHTVCNKYVQYTNTLKVVREFVQGRESFVSHSRVLDISFTIQIQAHIQHVCIHTTYKYAYLSIDIERELIHYRDTPSRNHSGYTSYWRKVI